jgi:hypothetical protein
MNASGKNQGQRRKRWLLREPCGCRVIQHPLNSTFLRFRHCRLHGAAYNMLFLIAELALRASDAYWKRRADAVCRDLEPELSDMLGMMERMVNDKQELRAHYLDAETAVLRGRAVDRRTTLCRICDATLPASDEARLLHMRSDHKREWRKLTQ